MPGPQRDENGKLLQFRGPPDSPECRHCPCARDGKPETAVRAFGATGGLAVVGEGPGSEEVFQRYPFVGPSGKLINRALGIAGIDRQLLWVTNALLCARPREDSLLAKAIECCRPRLEQELAAIQPTTILAFGGTAMQALDLPVTGVSDGRGTVQNTRLCAGIPVFSTMHPAALLRGGAGTAGDVSGGSNKQNVDTQMLFFQADIEKAYKVAMGELPPAWSDDIEAFVPTPTAPVHVEAPTAPVVEVEVPKDAVTEMVKAGFDKAFMAYYTTTPAVWRRLIDMATKAKEKQVADGTIMPTTDMLWGAVCWTLKMENGPDVPVTYKPYYLRLLKIMHSDLLQPELPL